MRSNDNDLQKLEATKEVFISEDQAFEAPAKEFVPGPYYKNIEEVMPELTEQAAKTEKAAKKLPVDRRDFMRLFGASAVMASTACVRRPVERAVPYVNQPTDQVPGLPVYYATTPDGHGVIVKTREGRPVMIEGNPEHPLSQGSCSSFAISELQALFHPDRRKNPQVLFGNNRRDDATWDEVYSRMAAEQKALRKLLSLQKRLLVTLRNSTKSS